MKEYHIRWPETDSEFEVQSELYQTLRDCGLKVRGEVRAFVDDFGKHRVRLDIVVFDDALKPKVIVECKNTNDGKTRLNPNYRQSRRYARYGLPLFKCSGIPFIDETKDLVLNALDGKLPKITPEDW